MQWFSNSTYLDLGPRSTQILCYMPVNKLNCFHYLLPWKPNQARECCPRHCWDVYVLCVFVFPLSRHFLTFPHPSFVKVFEMHPLKDAKCVFSKRGINKIIIKHNVLSFWYQLLFLSTHIAAQESICTLLLQRRSLTSPHHSASHTCLPPPAAAWDSPGSPVVPRSAPQCIHVTCPACWGLLKIIINK